MSFSEKFRPSIGSDDSPPAWKNVKIRENSEKKNQGISGGPLDADAACVTDYRGIKKVEGWEKVDGIREDVTYREMISIKNI